MAEIAVTYAEAREREYLRALQIAGAGAVVLLLGAALFYFGKFGQSEALTGVVRVAGGLLSLSGVVTIGMGAWRAVQSRSLPRVPFGCPYCDRYNIFTSEPHTDFACEFCNRTVHFQNGEQVPVHAIECQSCHTLHRVAVTLSRYVCDKCNHTLELVPESLPATPAAVRHAANGHSEEGIAYDVVITSVERAKQEELVYCVQNLLTISAAEARRLLMTVSMQNPLTIGFGLPERKAATVRQQAEATGASVLLRPSGSAVPLS